MSIELQALNISLTFSPSLLVKIAKNNITKIIFYVFENNTLGLAVQ